MVKGDFCQNERSGAIEAAALATSVKNTTGIVISWAEANKACIKVYCKPLLLSITFFAGLRAVLFIKYAIDYCRKIILLSC